MADAKAAPSPRLWQWIPLSEYQRPAPPVHHQVRRLWPWGGTPAETEPSADTAVMRVDTSWEATPALKLTVAAAAGLTPRSPDVIVTVGMTAGLF